MEVDDSSASFDSVLDALKPGIDTGYQILYQTQQSCFEI